MYPLATLTVPKQGPILFLYVDESGESTLQVLNKNTSLAFYWNYRACLYLTPA